MSEEEIWICCKCGVTNYEDICCSDCSHEKCDDCDEEESDLMSATRSNNECWCQDCPNDEKNGLGDFCSHRDCDLCCNSEHCTVGNYSTPILHAQKSSLEATTV